MLLTQLIGSQLLSVKCKYSTYYVNKFRKIPGATFDKPNKRWIVPVGAFSWFEQEFKGEIIYKSPRWVILNEPMPDYTAMYKLKHDITVPKMKLKPFDYQIYGIKFMVDKLLDKHFIINADDVGLGKTIQAIGTMKYIIEHSNINRLIIVCKKSIKRQWISEILKFTDLDKYMYIKSIEGTKAKRLKNYREFYRYKNGILVVNYHTVLNDIDILLKLKFSLMIIDEAHCVKARKGKMNTALQKIGSKTDYNIFLTGTPITSKPEDIFGVVSIADKNYFGKWKNFDDKYIRKERRNFGNIVIGYKELDDLRQRVQDIVIRRTEYEVSLDLPKQMFIRKDCEKDSVQENIQDAIMEYKSKLISRVSNLRSKQTLNTQDQIKLIKAEGMIKGLLSAEQAVANDPRLFLISKSKVMQKIFGVLVPKSYKMSSKTETLIDLVQNIFDNNEKVIVFSKFETSARMLQQDIKTNLKVNVLMYTGQIDDEAREDAIDKFKNSYDYNIIIGTDALAEGVNLQCANHVINFDQPYTPACKVQRAGRVRRVGSAFKRVFVYDLITLSSEDIKILDSINKAQGLFDGIVSVNKAQSEALKTAIKQV